MNTKAGLGVSPIISVSYSVATIWGHNFGNTTLLLYSVFVLAEMILHSLLAYRRKKAGVPSVRKLSTVLLMDAMQFPLSLIFTRFLNVFGAQIVLTGVGAALSLDMRLIPNPGDGIVQTLSDFSGGSVGLTKNCFDIGNVLLTSAIGLLMAGQLVGIGLGTILSMIGVGRVIAVFNHFYFHKTAVLAGLQLS